MCGCTRRQPTCQHYFHRLTITPANPLCTGTLLAQWHVQEGCWQVPASWQSVGSLLSDPITDAQVLALRPPAGYGTLLHDLTPAAAAAAAAASGGERAAKAEAGPGKVPPGQVAAVQLPVVCGDAVVALERLRKVQRCVRDMRQRLESPAAPTDIFGAATPSEAELAAAKHVLECCLAAVPEDDMPPPPTTLPEARPSQQHRSQLQCQQRRQMPASRWQRQGPKQQRVLSSCCSSRRQVQVWVKVEALLHPEDGLELVDEPLCAWLQSVLQQRTKEAR